MSSGSYFTLLRKTKSNIKFSQKFVEEFIIHKYNELTIFNPNKNSSTSLENMKNNICNFYQLNNFKYISITDNQELDILMEFHFSSTFTILKNEFNMNPYNNTCIQLLNLNDCKEMKVALEYILSYEYSKHFENILDNYYINLFGDDIPFFQYRFNSNKINQELESEEISKEIIHFYKKLKDILSIYILLEKENTLNEAEYFLLYTCF